MLEKFPSSIVYGSLYAVAGGLASFGLQKILRDDSSVSRTQILAGALLGGSIGFRSGHQEDILRTYSLFEPNRARFCSAVELIKSGILIGCDALVKIAQGKP